MLWKQVKVVEQKTPYIVNSIHMYVFVFSHSSTSTCLHLHLLRGKLHVTGTCQNCNHTSASLNYNVLNTICSHSLLYLALLSVHLCQKAFINVLHEQLSNKPSRIFCTNVALKKASMKNVALRKASRKNVALRKPRSKNRLCA